MSSYFSLYLFAHLEQERIYRPDIYCAHRGNHFTSGALIGAYMGLREAVLERHHFWLARNHFCIIFTLPLPCLFIITVAIVKTQCSIFNLAAFPFSRLSCSSAALAGVEIVIYMPGAAEIDALWRALYTKYNIIVGLM